MIRQISVLLCIGCVLLGAALHGWATHRWELINSSNTKLSLLHEMKIDFSDYQTQEIPSEMPIKEKSKVTCYQYFSPSLNDTIVVSLTTGITGSVSTHTPDVCYVGSGYRMTKNPVKQTIELPGGKTAVYYMAEFEKKRASGVDRQRVRWAWTVNGMWEAPDSPRFHYLRSGELAKVYVVNSIPESNAEGKSPDSPAMRSFTAQVFAQYSAMMAR